MPHLHARASCIPVASKVAISGLAWHHSCILCHAEAISGISGRLPGLRFDRKPCHFERPAAMLCKAAVHADDQAAQDEFWQMPESVSFRFIDTAAGLTAFLQDLLPGGSLSDTDTVGIDAEWAPGAATPAAALLQLALRSSQTGACTALVLVSFVSGAVAPAQTVCLPSAHSVVQVSQATKHAISDCWCAGPHGAAPRRDSAPAPAAVC